MSIVQIDRAVSPLEPTGDGWTLEGLAVPYDVPVEVSDDGGKTTYWEAFAHGAYARDASAGGRWVNLMIGHAGDEGDRYLGRCTGLREERAGLVAEFRIDPDRRTHPQAEAARSGELRGWSVSTRVYRSRLRKDFDGRDVLVREACGLSHVAATAQPQYAGAGLLVAREHELIIEPSGTPRLDAIRAALAAYPVRA